MADPLFPPKQLTLVLLPITDVSNVGWVTDTDEVLVQFNASVTVTVYVPAARPDAVAPVPPEDQRYVYGGVPPLPVTVAEPLLPVKQLTFVIAVIDEIKSVGSVIITEVVVVQPRLSVTVTI